ncbi:hypothetical protein MmiAt1_12960 [Methanimicrococcus sp. At1]|uniref:Radical SAM core domain-containing protein n=1 Tax=Methanimicrococcus hacksteinii TaxID=3028293 RepID=A0ABU3VQL8_9EURY|nr:radical SAM protein [Methanimicrococcus sp. At1]MDV0445702.1 hypothetical protein [Methanimicrococcus sp. At1]
MQADESGSYNTFLTDGCLCCQKGAKMVLFVTGICHRDCFFCPLSAERKDKDVIFANERAVYSDSDVIDEARSMNAEGTGITGGEPLLELEKTVHYIRLLKNEFGRNHHIHLYTSTAPSDEDLKELAGAGLDEIRFHPPTEVWDSLAESDYEKSLAAAEKYGVCAGFEIPAIAGAEKVAEFAQKSGCFLNLNELEFSDTNAEELKKRGYTLIDDESNTVLGSAEIAKKAFEAAGIRLEENAGCSDVCSDSPADCSKKDSAKLNFCSSRYKDAVQLRLRLLRTAQLYARAFDEITEDGTVAFGRIKVSDMESFVSFLEEFDLPKEAYEIKADRDSIETACGIAEELAAILAEEDLSGLGKIQVWLIEQYPFENGFVVGSERIF